MRKFIFLVLTVFIIAVLLLVINFVNSDVLVNGMKIEKIEVYKYDPELPYGIQNVSLLKKDSLIRIFTKSKDLQLFKQALYDDSEVVSPQFQFELISPEYDIILYKSVGKPIRYNMWLGKGISRGSYSTGSKIYNLSEESTKALYKLISR